MIAPVDPPAPSPNPRAKNWTKDHCPSGLTSLDYLCEWLRTDHNFAKLQHGKSLRNGTAAEQCSRWMQKKGCITPRDAESIKEKVILLL